MHWVNRLRYGPRYKSTIGTDRSVSTEDKSKRTVGNQSHQCMLTVLQCCKDCINQVFLVPISVHLDTAWLKIWLILYSAGSRTTLSDWCCKISFCWCWIGQSAMDWHICKILVKDCPWMVDCRIGQWLHCGEVGDICVKVVRKWSTLANYFSADCHPKHKKFVMQLSFKLKLPIN